MVKIPVAIPAPLLPSSFVATTVAIEDAEIFTMLFPIKIVLKSFGESAVNFSTRLARLLPVSAKLRILILLMVVKAVSADEKKAESAIKITRLIS